MRTGRELLAAVAEADDAVAAAAGLTHQELVRVAEWTAGRKGFAGVVHAVCMVEVGKRFLAQHKAAGL